MSAVGTSRDALQAKLRYLREHPVGVSGMRDADILPIYEALMSAGESRTGTLHWFCDEAEPTVKEMAILLTRLHAYKHDHVETWRERMIMVLHGCCKCITGLEEAKQTSASTYYGAFSRDVCARFWASFEEWEVQSIVNALTGLGITPDSSKALDAASAPLVFYALSRAKAFTDPFIQQVFSKPFQPIPLAWPMDPPPPGYVILTIHEQSHVSSWALSHLEQVIATLGDNVLTMDRLTPAHTTLIMVLSRRLFRDYKEREGLAQYLDMVQKISLTFPFSSNSENIWKSVPPVLTLLSNESIVHFGLHKAVLNHLHDIESHFVEVVRSMLQITKKLGKKLWADDNDDYPQVVFDSIKDNPRFTDLVITYDHSEGKAWHMLLFLEIVRSLWDHPACGDILAKFAALTCEELQHERFESARPYITENAVWVLSAALRKASKQRSISHLQTTVSIIDIHFDFLLSIALQSDRRRQKPWEGARRNARGLLRELLKSDAEAVKNAFIEVSSLGSSTNVEAVQKLAPFTRRHIWSKIYRAVERRDSGAVRMILEIASIPAELDKLQKRAISGPVWKSYEAQKMEPHKDLLGAIEAVADGINASLSTFKDGFLDCVTRFANASTTSELKTFLAEDSTVKNLVSLLTSPVEDFNLAAQTLISQAYDVDGRVECFRTILEQFPKPAFEGLVTSLESFNTFAPQVPEACAAAKSLVRCMTDVNDVLGSLLKEKSFLNRKLPDFSLKTEIPKLWKAMAKSIAVIFKCTPSWSVYFEKEVMTDWMRDALIFARELLGCRRLFEAAMDTRKEEDVFLSPRKQSRRGKHMVEDLQDVLIELQSWLRLTHMELLYQAFNLLKSLFQCFVQTEVKPNPDASAKLSKFIENNKLSKGVKRSYLNQADLAELEAALADFEEKDETEESDDEVQIISISHKGKLRDSSPEVEEVLLPPKHITKLSSSAKEVRQSKLDLSKEAGPSKRTLKLDRKRVSSPPTSVPVSASSESSSDEDNDNGLASLISRAELPVKSRRTQLQLQKSKAPLPRRDSMADDLVNSVLTNAQANEARRREEARRMEAFEKKQRERKAGGRRQVQIIEDPELRRAREEARERARKQEERKRENYRLKPDLKPLHRTILSWNYDHDGANPPRFNDSRVIQVPDTFNDQEQYLRVFEPLLTLECWAQILKSKEEPAETLYCQIQSRSHVDKWLDLDVIIDSAPFPEWRLNPDVDIVLLRNMQSRVSIMAKVTAFKKTFEGWQVGLTCCTEALSHDPGLIGGSTWELKYVLNLNTLHREFSALVGLGFCDINNLIYQPSLSDPATVSAREIQDAMRNYQVNEPQAKAILSSMSTKGFSLIQGPPGTGKTWTICGLVGASLSSRLSAPKPVGVPGRDPQPKLPERKILVCAPSNAAIDEVAKRLADGVRDSTGRIVRPKIVRVGNDAVINVSVKDISLDSLVAQKLAADGVGDGENSSEAAKLRAEIAAVRGAIDSKLAELQTVQNNINRVNALQQECDALKIKRIQLSQNLDKLRDNKKSNSRTLDATKRRYRNEILSEADVICTTLSGSGSDQLISLDFSMVIIDEAAQAVELSSLIPLKYQSDRYIMVGDPQQLPPTVLSPEASKWGYEQSLFVRMQRSKPSAVHLLSIQYRMHPEISRLPSNVFYEGRLLDGPDMASKTAQRWHKEPRFGVYKFFNAVHGREEGSAVGHSLFNKEECRIVAAFYDRLTKQFPKIDFAYRIGVVTMYRAQLVELKKLFKSRFGADIIGKIDFNTVDGFQGQEKDIIILSCVRAGAALKSIGFLSDVRRVNVAITRCRTSLYIVGHAPTLERSDKTWKVIVDDARTRQCLVDLPDLSYFTKNIAYSELNNAARGLGSGTDTPDISPMNVDNDAKDAKPKRKLPKGATRKMNPEKSQPSQRVSPAPNANGGTRSPLEDGEISAEASFDIASKVSDSAMGNSSSSGSLGLKRAAEGNHESRPSPVQRQGSKAGPSKPNGVMPRPNLPPKPRGPDLKAEKALEAYRKRKEQNNDNSLFIKKR